MNDAVEYLKLSRRHKLAEAELEVARAAERTALDVAVGYFKDGDDEAASALRDYARSIRAEISGLDGRRRQLADEMLEWSLRSLKPQISPNVDEG